MVWLYGLAAAFEIPGLLLALVGFTRTWSEYGPEGNLSGAVTEPITKAAKAVAAVVKRAAVKVFRIRQDAVVHSGVAEGMTGVATLEGYGQVMFGPLPNLEVHPEAFAATVNERLNTIYVKTQDVELSVIRETKAREKAFGEVRDALAQVDEKAEALVKNVAAGGLVLQVQGWVLVFIGIVIGAGTQIYEAWLAR